MGTLSNSKIQNDAPIVDHSSILKGETSQDDLDTEVVTDPLNQVPGKVDNLPVSNADSIANKKRNEYEDIMPQNDTESENQDTNTGDKVPDPNAKSRLQIRMEFENEGYIVRKKEETETEVVDDHQDSEVEDDLQETDSRTTDVRRVFVGAWMIVISWVLFEMKG